MNGLTLIRNIALPLFCAPLARYRKTCRDGRWGVYYCDRVESAAGVSFVKHVRDTAVYVELINLNTVERESVVFGWRDGGRGGERRISMR